MIFVYYESKSKINKKNCFHYESKFFSVGRGAGEGGGGGRSRRASVSEFFSKIPNLNKYFFGGGGKGAGLE